MTLCDQDQFDVTEPDGTTGGMLCRTFSLCSDSHAMPAFLSVYVPNESDGIQLSESQVSRLFCHFVVQNLPDAAFEEAVESLAGMHEFYQDYAPALPAPPPYQSVKAKVTGHYTAPVYPITEE